MNDWRILFGQNLRYLRQVHGLTQVEMARIVAVSVSSYRKMEHSDPRVRIHSGRVRRICLRCGRAQFLQHLVFLIAVTVLAVHHHKALD